MIDEKVMAMIDRQQQISSSSTDFVTATQNINADLSAPSVSRSSSVHHGVIPGQPTPLGVGDDDVSLHPSETASKCFNNYFKPHSRDDQRSLGSRSLPSQHSASVGGKEEGTTDVEQLYWDSIISEYTDEREFGAEVSSHLACATKQFWTKSLDETKLKKVMTKGKTPDNCRFIAVKPCNKVIFSNSSPMIRNNDMSLQDIQECHGAMSTLLIQALGELRKLLKQADVSTVADTLKDCLLLAGETNQRLNQHRRNLFKPLIVKHLKTICESPKEDAKELFGDNINERLTEIEKENALKEKFAPSPKKEVGKSLKTFKKPEARYEPYHNKEIKSSNFKASHKTQGGQFSGQKKDMRDKGFNSKDRQHNNSSNLKNKKNTTQRR